MQQRHIDRRAYFDESAETSKDFYIDYIEKFKRVDADVKILEIGCGEGGNLMPFARIGCCVTGIDLSGTKVNNAKKFFSQDAMRGRFDAINFFDMTIAEYGKFDVILIHDVIEHISAKELFLEHLKQFIQIDGLVFFGFPAWQMPFGGHQQVCRSRVCSKMPFIHLLPRPIYKGVLSLFGEHKGCIDELLDIKECKLSIERFERLVRDNGFSIADRDLWFINPHYKQKFNLKPRRLSNFMSSIRYIRNYFTTSCFYLVKLNDKKVKPI